ncbi:MAG: radical SAM protein [Planctomycetes bacterium]|nr:radical SAM protein [Planctomycetota bacterium]
MAKRIEIIVKTTDACNARCAYCSAGSDPTGRRSLSGEAAHLLLRQADELIASGRAERVRFLWHGGEPLLLGKGFFRELAAVFQGLPRRAGIAHRIQTNLTLLDEEWVSILEPLIGRDGLGTSLDPFDEVRQLGEGDGYRRRWLAGLDLLDRVGWKAGCVYVLHRLGLPRAKDLYWFFRNLRDNSMLSLRVNPLLRVGRAKEALCEGLLLSPGDYGRFLTEIADVWLGDHRRLILTPVRDLARAWEGGAVTSCDLAGRAGCVEGHLGVDPDGFVYNCGRAVDAGGMRFGRLGEVSLEECLEHASRRVLLDREDALLSGRCGDCAYWRFCHGGCPYESHTESEQAHQPTVLCEDYRLFLEWLRKKASGQSLDYARDKRSAVSGQPESSVGGGAMSVCWPQNPFWGLPPGGFPSSLSPNAEWIPPEEAARKGFRAERAEEVAGKGLRAERAEEVAGKGLRAERAEDAARKGFRAERQSAVSGQEECVSVFPSTSGGGVAGVRSAVSSGKPVVLADPRAWSPADLRSLAEFFLHDPDLSVPIEPFYSALMHLTGGAILGGRRSLRQMYGEAVPTRCPDLPCATCEAFKFCRGFWLDPQPLQEHCRAWRELSAMMARLIFG